MKIDAFAKLLEIRLKVNSDEIDVREFPGKDTGDQIEIVGDEIRVKEKSMRKEVIENQIKLAKDEINNERYCRNSLGVVIQSSERFRWKNISKLKTCK